MPLPLVLGATTLVLGFLPTAWLWHARAQQTGGWLLTLATAGGLVAFAYMAGPWLFVSYYLRYVAGGAFAVVALASLWLRRATVPSVSADPRWSGLAVRRAALVGVSALDVLAFTAGIAPAGALDLGFPLSHGRYTVLQGGNGFITNPFHRSSPGERFALDLAKLNRYGARANGLAPRTLAAYAVFDDSVIGPCSGTVVEARNGALDSFPDRVHVGVPAGNHIILRCDGVDLLLAHLRHGSVAVRSGQRAVPGQFLGRVGNSGNSSEPHLHISASRSGKAVPLTFGGRFLSLNSIYTVGRIR